MTARLTFEQFCADPQYREAFRLFYPGADIDSREGKKAMESAWGQHCNIDIRGNSRLADSLPASIKER